jgi:hypothetical protein
MTQTFSRSERIGILLGALVGERHLRRVLLKELAAELGTTTAGEAAAAAATALSAAAEALDTHEFNEALGSVARLVPCLGSSEHEVLSGRTSELRGNEGSARMARRDPRTRRMNA